MNENDKALIDIMIDTQKQYTKSNKTKDKIIIILIILMFLEAVIGYTGFVWYESQFETTTTETVEVGTEGDNANAEYNDVSGNQYNDSATHTETKGGDN